MQRMIMVVCGLLSCTGPAWAENLLRGPGFEDLDGDAPRGWTSFGASGVAVNENKSRP